MSRFLESIRIQNLKAQNLAAHQDRLESTQKAHFENYRPIDLEQLLQANLHHLKADLVYKCRIVYDSEVQRISFLPYSLRPIRSLKLVFDDHVSYSYKSEDRAVLQRLLEEKNKFDDILIIKNAKVTDSSYCNVLFYDGIRWKTPQEPLLAGTERARLLQTGQVLEAEINFSDIQSFKYFKLVNAMRPFEQAQVIPISQIL